MSSSLPGQASKNPDEAAEENTCRLAEAIQEAEACRTRSDSIDINPETLMCSSTLLRAEDHLLQGSHSRTASPKRHSGTEQRPTARLDMCPIPERTEPNAAAAYQASIAFSLTNPGASHYSEARAQRRRRRAITAMPDQENLLTIQAAILDIPEAAMQKPLKSRTNLLRRRAASLRADCKSCDADALLRAALCGVPSGNSAGQHMWTREDAYKPLSAQLTCSSLIDSNRKQIQAPDAATCDAACRGTAGLGLMHDPKPEQEASKGGALDVGKQWWAPPVPTYMRSTVSMRAKADVATEQVKACKASQRDKRRWTY
ncbi:g9899 [Coccomyxa viridis]|uniref:G9899 protein n=1 Tax=Coccomyxa viridis TaxID=1274662 RepID=A0ABP1GB22_9CHLO